jgi:ankyrin repeat protein
MLYLVSFFASLSLFSPSIEQDPFVAVRSNDIRLISKLVRTPAEANRRLPTSPGQNSGATLLMQAAIHGEPALMKLLLDRGADPNLTNPLGATALHWAAGNPAKVALLLKAGADPNAKSNLGRTPLLIAATTPGNSASVRLLLAKGANPKLLDSNGDGPLGSAASSGDLQMLRLLLAAGADVNEIGSRGPAMRGITPLLRATAASCLPCVELLLASGANPNHISAPPRAIKSGLQDMGSLTPLVIASHWNNPAIAKSLIAAGAKLETPDARGLTPLLMAVTTESQDPRTVDLLLSLGANKEARSRDGQSAADWIAKWGPNSPFASRIPPSRLPGPPSIPRPDSTPRAEEAISRSIDLMLRSNTAFFEKSGCPGCHHQVLSGMLFGAAKQHAISFNSALAEKQLSTVLTVSQVSRESILQRVAVGGAPYANAILLASLAAQNVPPSGFTDALVHDIAGAQLPNGSWLGMVQRPPMNYSLVTETAFSMRAIQAYASPGRAKELSLKVNKASRWLQAYQPSATEEHSMRILGLVWAGAKPSTKDLVSLQQPNGGWSQRPGLSVDAYATGQALYALAQAGVSTTSLEFRKGISWLLENQARDGSWYVASRSVKFQPYFDSGFPYGHDQWISAAATAWAGLALTTSLP